MNSILAHCMAELRTKQLAAQNICTIINIFSC